MPASARPWREAIAVLAAAGWDERDIAAVLHLSLGTVYRELGVRFWERPAPSPAATCSQRVGEFWCDRPVRPGEVYCADHWRLAWPQ